MAHDVVLIPGDGIGPEITSAMRRVVEATGVQINWNVQNAGAGVMDEYGTPLPEHVLEAVRATKVAIKGPITTPVGTGSNSMAPSKFANMNMKMVAMRMGKAKDQMNRLFSRTSARNVLANNVPIALS